MADKVRILDLRIQGLASSSCTPANAPQLAGVEGGLQIGARTIPFNEVRAFAIYRANEREGGAVGMLLFQCGNPRPFRVLASGIQLRSFPIPREHSSLPSLRRLGIYLCHRCPGVILDRGTYAMLSGKPPFVLDKTVHDLATAFARGLGDLPPTVPSSADGAALPSAPLQHTRPAGPLQPAPQADLRQAPAVTTPQPAAQPPVGQPPGLAPHDPSQPLGPQSESPQPFSPAPHPESPDASLLGNLFYPLRGSAFALVLLGLGAGAVVGYAFEESQSGFFAERPGPLFWIAGVLLLWLLEVGYLESAHPPMAGDNRHPPLARAFDLRKQFPWVLAFIAFGVLFSLLQEGVRQASLVLLTASRDVMHLLVALPLVIVTQVVLSFLGVLANSSAAAYRRLAFLVRFDLHARAFLVATGAIFKLLLRLIVGSLLMTLFAVVGFYLLGLVISPYSRWLSPAIWGSCAAWIMYLILFAGRATGLIFQRSERLRRVYLGSASFKVAGWRASTTR